jgi:hypothetical protein
MWETPRPEVSAPAPRTARIGQSHKIVFTDAGLLRDTNWRHKDSRWKIGAVGRRNERGGHVR